MKLVYAAIAIGAATLAWGAGRALGDSEPTEPVIVAEKDGCNVYEFRNSRGELVYFAKCPVGYNASTSTVRRDVLTTP